MHLKTPLISWSSLSWLNFSLLVFKTFIQRWYLQMNRVECISSMWACSCIVFMLQYLHLILFLCILAKWSISAFALRKESLHFTHLLIASLWVFKTWVAAAVSLGNTWLQCSHSAGRAMREWWPMVLNDFLSNFLGCLWSSAALIKHCSTAASGNKTCKVK